jgi:hypothetical protein
MNYDASSIGSHLTNIKKENAEFIVQSAAQTGFDIRIGKPSHALGESYIGVYSYEGLKDHGPFWKAYRTLKEALEREG